MKLMEVMELSKKFNMKGTYGVEEGNFTIEDGKMRINRVGYDSVSPVISRGWFEKDFQVDSYSLIGKETVNFIELLELSVDYDIKGYREEIKEEVFCTEDGELYVGKNKRQAFVTCYWLEAKFHIIDIKSRR